ncbi:MAG: DUF6122 family protein [Candidatus Cyclobacteriaceae bacterium M3_2C_046]
MQLLLHYTLHFGGPFLIAFIFFRSNWKLAGIILLATNLVDLDHLWADPIFDDQRCSIGFHFLHSYLAIAFYLVFLIFPKTRLVAIGLLFHMFTDLIDCVWTFSECAECYRQSELFELFN